VALLSELKKPTNDIKLIEACKQFVTDNYLTFSPSCGSMIEEAKKRGQWREFQSPAKGMPAPGDYVFWNFGTEDKPERHVSQFWKWDHSHVWSVEWNTVEPGGDGKSGCFVRARAPEPGLLLGWAAWHGTA
jgi:hypothetical protein